MSLHLLLITISSFFFLLLVNLTSMKVLATKMAKIGCPETCGNLTIPYPFGIGKGCYFDPEFEVSCDNSTHVASLPSYGGLNIYRISTEFVGVKSRTPAFLFNQSTGEHLDGDIIGDAMSTGHYNLSYTQNKLVAVGCDVFALIKDRSSGEIISECASFCKGNNNSSRSSCSGYGCCESLNISKPLTNFSASMHTMNTRDKSWSGRSCGFLFIVDKNFSDFGKINVSNCDESYELPLVMDWTISNRSCSEGRMICGENSDCQNYKGRSGYSCHCKQGYEGNPYLPSGCQDINECAAKDNCPKNAYCVNRLGSFSCNCNPGYHKEGDRCVPDDQHKQNLVLYLCLGIGLSIGILLTIALGVWLHKDLKRRKHAKAKKQFFKKNGGMLLQQQISFNNKATVVDIKVFTIEELEKATDNFHVGRILGKGGLGTVYKGMLSDGSIVALKKPNELDEKQVHQFINEIFILSQINHRNIVKVLGCCLEVEVPIIVYEYVPNGDLSYYLHAPQETGNYKNNKSLSWKDRLRIAAEVAGALAYLHSSASMAIFHRDIKTSNILLDENFKAVVSDFGLSRSVPVDKTHLTTIVGGTFGYLDPEYFLSGQLNDKSDVYAFGVVLLELLTGLTAVSSVKDECLVNRFVSLNKQNRVHEILDKEIVGDAEGAEVLIVTKIASKCLKWSSRKRPSMKEVAAELDGLMRKMGMDLVSPQMSMQDNIDYCSFSHLGYSYSFETGEEEEESIYSVDATIPLK